MDFTTQVGSTKYSRYTKLTAWKLPTTLAEAQPISRRIATDSKRTSSLSLWYFNSMLMPPSTALTRSRISYRSTLLFPRADLTITFAPTIGQGMPKDHLRSTYCGTHCVTTPKVLAPAGGFALGSYGLMSRRNSSGIAFLALARSWSTNYVKGKPEFAPWI